MSENDVIKLMMKYLMWQGAWIGLGPGCFRCGICDIQEDGDWGAGGGELQSVI